MSDPAAPPVPLARTCPACGGAIPADAPQVAGAAACPRCLLGAGIPTGARAPIDVPRAADVAALFPDHEILGLLGRGGMGVVWKARQRSLDRVVALKVLPRDVAGVPGFAERFQREARALARLAHPNIVGVHEFGERDGTCFLVLEYVEGVNMRTALREGRIAPHDALRIVPQICDALQYAHEHGVVHRDIKPENVLIDADGRVKVTDFGIAKIVAAGDGPNGRPDLTMTGQVMGTPHYMAPEQWERPTSVDHRADIYSLGVVFYEMLTGELPLGRFPPPSEKVRVDVRIDEVVLRSLEKAPERRWQRATDVKCEMDGIAATPEPPAPVRPGDTPRVSLLAVSGAAAPLAAVALGGLVFAIARVAGSRVDEAWFLFAGGVVVVAGWIASIVAWTRIGMSGGRLRGRGFAIVGTLLPVTAAIVVDLAVQARRERIATAMAVRTVPVRAFQVTIPQPVAVPPAADSAPSAGAGGTSGIAILPLVADSAAKGPTSSSGKGLQPASPTTPALPGALPWFQQHGVSELWTSCVEAVRRADVPSLLGLYPPDLREPLRGIDPTDLDVRDVPDDLGLPYWASLRGPRSLDGFRIVSMTLVTTKDDVAERRLRAVVTAVNGPERITFHVVGQLRVGAASRPPSTDSEVEWSFDRRPVTTKQVLPVQAEKPPPAR